MVVLGIVLIVLAVLFGLGVAVSPYTSTKLEVFGVDFGVAVPTVFFLGAAAGAICVLGLWLAKKGLGRGYRKHKEVRELRQRAAAAETAHPAADEVAPAGADREPAADNDLVTGRADDVRPAGADRAEPTERRHSLADGN